MNEDPNRSGAISTEDIYEYWFFEASENHVMNPLLRVQNPPRARPRGRPLGSTADLISRQRRR